MNNNELVRNISFELSSIAHCRLGQEWNYNNIISSFTRLYLITEGEAFAFMANDKIKLKKGHLYLFPSFTRCSYVCPEYMEQYYATFTIKLPNNISVYQLFHFKNEIKAEAHHYDYFEKLCSQNQGMTLPSGNPKAYQRRMKLDIPKRFPQNPESTLVSNGLLSLLVSGFITSNKMDLSSEAYERILDSIKFIQANLGEILTVEKLAKRACMSADHFTRKFKELTEQTPVDYINRQRVEKAQLLLNTTSHTFTEIAYQCGFKSNTYFCNVFKKYVHQSPRDYKNENLSI